MKLLALKSLRYATRRLLPGDSFEAKDRDAKLLIAIKKAEAQVERVPGRIDPPPADLLAQVEGQARTQGEHKDALDHDGDGRKGGSVKQPDSEEISALRAAYQQRFGKKPFAGWDVESLKEKLAAASDV